MRIRNNILPRRSVDWFCFLLITIALPIVYIFEMSVVLSAFHEVGGFFHTFTFLISIFFIFNIKGNMLACVMVDTSINVIIENPKSNAVGKKLGWSFCDECNKWRPPRTWHCKVCCTCILKRDHHCLFTGCCIGYRNHRYFIMFILYMFIGSMYAFVYNSYYLFVLNNKQYWNLFTPLKILCPALYLFSDTKWHGQNLYLIYYSLNILALLYSVVLLCYHGPTVLKGGVCFERDKGYPYDAGWKQNLRSVLGKRAHLTWLSPLLESELTTNDITWGKKDALNRMLNKND